MLATKSYKEQVAWRDASTGRVLAESDFFEPMGLDNLITPGFGGRTYDLTDRGFIGCRHVNKVNAGAACHLEGEAERQSLSRSKIAF
jgi:hypothetical protein